jgi:predicted regulator of Ras-like GTPase activity (Roadblock/LC7/MglB family)
VKNLIEPLTRIPGVRTAALVTTDGVLMAMHSSTDNSREGAGTSRGGSSASGAAEARGEGGERTSTDAALDPQALAGLATSWLSEVTRAVAPLSWQPPRHLVLRAARGTMIVCEAPGAILCVVLESGMQPEELRLPMGVTIARMQRHLRDIGQRAQRNAPEIESIRGPVTADIEHPPSIRPALPSNSPHGQAVPLGHGEPIVHATGKGVSESSGD